MDWNATMLMGLKVLAVLVLVLLNGFFVAAEFALVKIRDTQLDPLIKKGNRRAKVTREIIGNLDASLSACQLGITLASLALGWVGEPIFTVLLEPVFTWLRVDSQQVRHTVSFAVGFSVITFLHITAGEQAPKWLAIQKPLPASLLIALPLQWFYRISYPFIWLLNGSSLWLLRRLGIEPMSESEMIHSEEELRLLFSASQKHKGGSLLGRDIVFNALDLKRRVVRDVMRHRQEIVSLNTEDGIAECLEIAERTRYSRFPLCEKGNLDRTLGVVHFKDLFTARLKAKRGADLLATARKLIYVPESARLEKLLQLFLERRLHFAIVVDEYGGTVGMVTLENILEELVGQIQDEFDQEKPLLQKVNDSTWEIAGTLPIHELAELVGEPLAEEGVTTTSGLVTTRQGGFPREGDVIVLGGFDLKVEETDGLKVSKLKLTRREPETPKEAPTEENAPG